jgi:hypothetical protein
MIIREVTADKFQELRTQLNEAESVKKVVPIGAISVDNESLKHGNILIGGQAVKVSPGFFYKLGAMLKVNVSLTRSMINKGDHQIAASLINALKEYQIKNSKSTEVMLIANAATREIVDICSPGRYRRVTNDTVLDVAERIVNDNPGLIIETVDFNPNSGSCSINLLNNEEIGFAQAGKDEFFKFGFSIIQTSRDTLVESYNQRLICSNGLRTSLGEGAIGGNRGITFEDRFRLGGNTTEDIRIFLNRIEEMKKANFVSPTFNAAISRAVGTQASLAEVEHALKTANHKVEELDPQFKKDYQAAIARKHFHAYGDTLARIVRKGQDPNNLNDRQKQFIKTGMSVWDVVNSLTFLGSNNSGIPLENKHELKYTAGELFSKGVKDGFDLEFAQFASL